MREVPVKRTLAGQPVACLAAAFSLGVFAAHVSEIDTSLLLVLAGMSTTCALAAFIFSKTLFATWLLLVVSLLLGGAVAAFDRNCTPPNQLKSLVENGAVKLNQPLELNGTLAREPEPAPDRLFIHLEVESVAAGGKKIYATGVVLLQIEAINGKLQGLNLRYGTRIRAVTSLKRNDEYRNPGVSSFTEYLDREGYDATGFIKSAVLIEPIDRGDPVTPLALLYRWRSRLHEAIHSRFERDTAAVLDAAFLGNRYFLSRETAERFREGGTFHVLVISGLHITFIGTVIFYLAGWITLKPGIRVWLSIAVLWGYSLAVGAESSVLRAALMFSVVLLARLFSRRASSLNALGCAAVVLLVWRPLSLFDPSFQLTFISVLAIVALAWPLLERMARIGKWHPTRETPLPPSCPSWFREFCEILFWRERDHQKRLARANYSYRLFKTPLAIWLERYHLQLLLRYCFGAIIVSTSVQIFLLPFFISYFHRFSIASFVLNIAISVIMAATGFVAAIALIVSQFSSEAAKPLVMLTECLNWLMVHSVDPFRMLRTASIRVPDHTGLRTLVYIVYYVPLVVSLFGLSRWNPFQSTSRDEQTVRNSENFLPTLAFRLRTKRLADRAIVILKFGASRFFLPASVLVQLILAVIIVFHPVAFHSPNSHLRIDYLDVGQGDSALITFPGGVTLLIDGGGRPVFGSKEKRDQIRRDTRGIGEAVVSEYLWWRELERVDYVIATHADADHIEGLNDVIRNFKPRCLLVARMPTNDPEFAKLSETASLTGVPVRLIAAGDTLGIASTTIKVIWPPPSIKSNASRNNESIVVRVQFGNRSFLFTGDIEKDAESLIVQRPEDFSADVVKVAHHGSKTSSTPDFIQKAGASLAVISVGRHSMFGHPHNEVVRRWQDAGARIMTTGKSGTITVTTNGSDLRVETFVRN